MERREIGERKWKRIKTRKREMLLGQSLVLGPLNPNVRQPAFCVVPLPGGASLSAAPVPFALVTPQLPRGPLAPVSLCTFGSLAGGPGMAGQRSPDSLHRLAGPLCRHISPGKPSPHSRCGGDRCQWDPTGQPRWSPCIRTEGTVRAITAAPQIQVY